MFSCWNKFSQFFGEPNILVQRKSFSGALNRLKNPTVIFNLIQVSKKGHPLNTYFMESSEKGCFFRTL